MAQNLKLVDHIKALAASQGCTTAQLALAWVLAQGEDMPPIPGTTKMAHLGENLAALDVILTREGLERINQAVPKGIAAGDRHLEMKMKVVNR